ncbi:hypothetical protein CRENBAI_003376 [Crenichthys baileyi]|uniref:Uncharacterized protein n=1 Tax=Crenichthys baileyi TaxID=28760 RepID=A0AAV9RVB2_9TELE
MVHRRSKVTNVKLEMVKSNCRNTVTLTSAYLPWLLNDYAPCRVVVISLVWSNSSADKPTNLLENNNLNKLQRCGCISVTLSGRSLIIMEHLDLVILVFFDAYRHL